MHRFREMLNRAVQLVVFEGVEPDGEVVQSRNSSRAGGPVRAVGGRLSAGSSISRPIPVTFRALCVPKTPMICLPLPVSTFPAPARVANPLALVGIAGVEPVILDAHESQRQPVRIGAGLDRHGADRVAGPGQQACDLRKVGAALLAERLAMTVAKHRADRVNDFNIEILAHADFQPGEQPVFTSDVPERGPTKAAANQAAPATASSGCLAVRSNSRPIPVESSRSLFR